MKYIRLILIFLGAAALSALEVPYLQNEPKLDAKEIAQEWRKTAVIPFLLPPVDRSHAAQVKEYPTEVRVGWRPEALYVMFRCHEKNIVAEKKDRDDTVHHDDAVEVFIDAVGDARQYLEIGVNPQNTVRDLLHLLTAEPRLHPAGSFTAEFVAKDLWRFDDWNIDGLKTSVHVADENGKIVWYTQIVIPAAAICRRLGKTELEPMSIRAQFCRFDRDVPRSRDPEGVFSSWTAIRYGMPQSMPRHMGTLKLMPNPR